MPDRPAIDPARVRRSFDRCARDYEGAAALAREVAGRMLERLDRVRMQPARVLDLGSGAGRVAGALLARYRGAHAVALDFSLEMLRTGRRAPTFWDRWRAPRCHPVCAAMERLPFADGTFDMVCSNLALEWSADPEQVLREVRRVLRRGGLMMFSTLGPDTLQELRAANAGRWAGPPLADMHDVGDALVRQGFVGPVMDAERITLTYPDVRALLSELRAIGCAGAIRPVSAGLRGRTWLARMEQGYREFERDGRVPASVEVVYGHAWKPEQPSGVTEDGRAVIRFISRPGC